MPTKLVEIPASMVIATAPTAINAAEFRLTRVSVLGESAADGAYAPVETPLEHGRTRETVRLVSPVKSSVAIIFGRVARQFNELDVLSERVGVRTREQSDALTGELCCSTLPKA